MSRPWSDNPANAHATFAMDDLSLTMQRDTELALAEGTRFGSSRRDPAIVDGDLSDLAGTVQRILDVLHDQGIVSNAVNVGAFQEIIGTPGLTPTIAPLAAAGNTATATVNSGADSAMSITINPSGTGIAAGSIATITFATVHRSYTDFPYIMAITPTTSAARTLGGVIGPTNRTGTSFDLATQTALTTGQVYSWDIIVVGTT